MRTANAQQVGQGKRTIGAFVVGAWVLLLSGHAVSDKRFWWLTCSLTVAKAETAAAERAPAVGTPVLTVDGAVAGKVSGLSRDARGYVERIRVTGPLPMGLGQRTLIIRNAYFVVEDHVVRLKLSVAELSKMPEAMMEDGAAE
jgi:hypothetical protein